MKSDDREPTGKPEGLTEAERAFYEKFKSKFSAADLQLYTELDEGVPLEQVIAEMERIHAEVTGARDTDAQP